MDAHRLHHREVTIGNRSVDYFEPEGPLMGDLLDLFDQHTTELLNRGRRDIRVGCRSLTLSSSAIGVLLSIKSRLSPNHGRLVIDYQGNERIRKLFAVTKLDGMFDDLDDGDPDAWTTGKSAPLSPPPLRGAPGNAKLPDPRPEDPEE